MGTKNIDNGNKKAARRRKITIIAAVVAVILSTITFIMMLLRFPNMHIVFYLVLGLSLLIIIYLVLWTLSASEKHIKLAKALKRCYMICMTVGLSFFLVMQVLIISGAHTEDAKADCIVILGAGLHGDVPSLVLRRRLNTAVQYLKEHGDIPIIVSGGQGPGETITEAEAMRRYLSARDVKENIIWKEEESTSTRENLAFSLSLMKEKGLDVEKIKVAVVSNEFHLYRAKLIAGKMGLDAFGIAAETPGIYLSILYSFREAFALASELLL